MEGVGSNTLSDLRRFLPRLKGFDESLLYSSGYFSSRNELISCIIATVNGVGVLSNLPVMYLYKDDFNIPPALLVFACGFVKLPMNIKMLFSFMSDSVPILGSRRRSYLTIGSFILIFSLLMLGIPDKQDIYTTTLYLTMSSLGITMCSVVGEALVVESGKQQTNDQITHSVSMFCAFRKLTYAAMVYLSAILIMVIPRRKIFLLSAIIPAIVFVSSFFVQERNVQVFTSVKPQWSRLVTFSKMKEIRRPATFLFITTVAPSAGMAMFYFMTNKLHFEPELFGRLAAVQALASIVGIYCYSKFCKRISVRKLFVFTTYLLTAFCLLSVVLVKRWNVGMGIPDFAFVLTDDLIMEFVTEIHVLPILVLSVRLCPHGIESSMYSFLWTVQLMGINVSTYISAILTYMLGVKNDNFDGLVPLIVICSLLHLTPIFFVWLIPEELPNEVIKEKSPEMELYLP